MFQGSLRLYVNKKIINQLRILKISKVNYLSFYYDFYFAVSHNKGTGEQAVVSKQTKIQGKK